MPCSAHTAGARGRRFGLRGQALCLRPRPEGGGHEAFDFRMEGGEDHYCECTGYIAIPLPSPPTQGWWT